MSSWSCFSLAETPPTILHSLHNPVPVPSSNTGILAIRSLLLLQPQALPLSRCALRQPAQHPSALPASATGLLLPGVLLRVVFQNCRAPWHLSLRSYLLCKAATTELSALEMPPPCFSASAGLITLYDNHSVTCPYPLLHWNYLKYCPTAYEIHMLSRPCCFHESLKSMYCMKYGCIYLRVKWVLGCCCCC